MAKPRVYRHDALCSKCGSNWVKKDGHSRGKQQYKCNSAAESVKRARSIGEPMSRKRKR